MSEDDLKELRSAEFEALIRAISCVLIIVIGVFGIAYCLAAQDWLASLVFVLLILIGVLAIRRWSKRAGALGRIAERERGNVGTCES
jgi:arginine exporter protein ArgO